MFSCLENITINNINIVQFDMETFKTKIILTVPVGQCQCQCYR